DVNKELKTTNYQVSKTVKKIRQMSGNIEKISAAILIDGTLINETDDKGNVKQIWQQRTPEEIARFENLVKNAIGFSTKRGDEVKIENMQFQQEDFTQVERDLARLNNQKLATQFFKWSLILVSLGLIFLVIVRPFIHWITDSFQDSVEDMLPRTIEELEELQTVDNSLPGMTSALPMIEETLDPEKAESELLKERIQNLIEKNEEKAANAFGMWLVRKD
ncbi:MAG: flagellar M-ring protein FliF, partial [Bdellovibrionales bacterium]|nr:flagellar M-ring protein FliF [Bdellovibrionales bacterium]